MKKARSENSNLFDAFLYCNYQLIKQKAATDYDKTSVLQRKSRLQSKLRCVKMFTDKYTILLSNRKKGRMFL